MKPSETADAMAAGAVLLDLRPPRPFAAEHVPGAVNLQFNRADLADRAELVLPAGLRLLVHAEPEVIARTAVELLRAAGFEVLGHLEGGLAGWKAAGEPTVQLPMLDVDELREQLDGYLVVDVREPFEYRHAHLPGALLFPSGKAWGRLDELPENRPLAVVCGDQTRSAAVASMLRRAGRDARLVMGGMVDWLDREYPVEHSAAPA